MDVGIPKTVGVSNVDVLGDDGELLLLVDKLRVCFLALCFRFARVSRLSTGGVLNDWGSEE